MQFFVDMLFGWVGLAGIAAIVCVVLAVIFPQFRLTLLAIGAGILGIASVYARGRKHQADLEQRRKDAAVSKVQKQYDEIDRRPDDVDHVKGRLKDGSF